MNKRKYSVFRKRNGRWERMSTLAFDKESAVRVFQNVLLAFAFTSESLELRPVKDEELSADEAREIHERVTHRSKETSIHAEAGQAYLEL